MDDARTFTCSRERRKVRLCDQHTFGHSEAGRTSHCGHPPFGHPRPCLRSTRSHRVSAHVFVAHNDATYGDCPYSAMPTRTGSLGQTDRKWPPTGLLQLEGHFMCMWQVRLGPPVLTL